MCVCVCVRVNGCRSKWSDPLTCSCASTRTHTSSHHHLHKQGWLEHSSEGRGWIQTHTWVYRLSLIIDGPSHACCHPPLIVWDGLLQLSLWTVLQYKSEAALARTHTLLHSHKHTHTLACACLCTHTRTSASTSANPLTLGRCSSRLNSHRILAVN